MSTVCVYSVIVAIQQILQSKERGMGIAKDETINMCRIAGIL